jgi:hypothetical protein
MRSPGFASSSAAASSSSGWATPVSPHTAARLSRTVSSPRPQRLATAAPMRDNVPGMQKWVIVAASMPLSASSAATARGTIFM